MKGTKLNHRKRSTLLWVMVALSFLVPGYAVAQSSNVSYFSLSDIGSPKPWKPGQVTVGDDIDVVITARDASGNQESNFNGMVFLSEQTDYGIGRVAPETVQLLDGEWQGKIKIFRAGRKKSDFQVVGDVWVSVTDNAGNPHYGNSNIFTAVPAGFSRLLVILPGEEHFPGSTTGRSGQPFNQQIGTEFDLEVLATDPYWNFRGKITDRIHLISSDPQADLPENANMDNGSVIRTVRLNTKGLQTITAFDVTDNVNIAPHTGSNVNMVENTPGEVVTFAFDPIPSPQTVGDTLQFTSRAVDDQGQTVTTYNEQASLTVSTGPGTIQVGNVTFSSGVWNGTVVLTKAEQNVQFTMRDFSNIEGQSNSFVLNPGPVARLQVLLPGESTTPGFAPGKSGHPETQFAGEPFVAQVLSTDAWWNPTDPGSLQLNFSSNDSQAVVPNDTLQTVSDAGYSFTFFKQGQNQINVTVANDPVLNETYSSSQFFVDPGWIDKFVISAIDSQQVAGAPFFVRIEAANREGKLVSNYNEDIILFASTGNGTISNTGVTLSEGFWEGELYVTRADSNVVLYAADYVAPPNTHNGSSNGFTVAPGSLAGLQVLWPQQAATPGVQPGRNGLPGVKLAGDSIAVVVRAVDEFWNLIPDHQDLVSFASTDTFAVVPDSIVLTDGKADASVVFRTAGTQQIFVNSVENAILPTALSDEVVVQSNQFTQLLLLLPGESLLPGDNESDLLRTPGRSGTPTSQTSGLSFLVDVYAVDNYFNPVLDAPGDLIRILVTDGQAVVSPADTFLVDGHTQFKVALTQGGSQVMRASDQSNSQIRDSMDGVVEVMVGGLHYEISIDVDQVTAGEAFTMHVFYKDGIGENVASANHLVRLKAVSANNLNQEVGTLQNASFNLQAGQRTVVQAINKAGLLRIEVEDDQGTQPTFSDPLRVIAGEVSTLIINSDKEEIGGTESTDVSVTLQDAAGNLIPGEEVQFVILSGQGSLEKNSAVTDSTGTAQVKFKAGSKTETNVIRASVGSLTTEIEVIVNLTKSDLADGVAVNYPNPFGIESESTRIDYYLTENADVTLKIFDLFGNLVWSKEISAGAPGAVGRQNNVHPNSIEWTGVNDKGQRVGNGGYVLLAKAVADGKVIMNTKRKIVVVR